MFERAVKPFVAYVIARMLSHFSPALLFATPCTVAQQALLSVKLSQQEHWSGLHALHQGFFLTHPGIEPGIEPGNEHISCFASRFFTPEPPGKLQGM